MKTRVTTLTKSISQLDRDVEALAEKDGMAKPTNTGVDVERITKDFLSTTTLHALPHIFQVPFRWLRVTWFLIFLGMTTVLVYHIQLIVTKYRSRPINTSINVHSDDNMGFPALTICNQNPIKRSLLDRTMPSVTKHIGVNQASLSLADGHGFKYTSDRESLQDLLTLDHIELNGGNIAKLLNRSNTLHLTDAKTTYSDLDNGRKGTSRAVNASDLIVECTYDSRSCDFETDFNPALKKKYGQCFVYNSPFKNRTLKTTQRYGSQYGLKLTLDIEANEYMWAFASEYGARITVHSTKAMSFPHMDGFNVPPGMSTEVAIRAKQIIRLPAPYKSECAVNVPDQFAHNSLVPSFANYTYQLCNVACIDTYLLRECGCIDQTEPMDIILNPNFPTFCDIFNKTQRECEQQIYTRFHLSKDARNALRCDCKFACLEHIYKLTVSMSQWPVTAFKRSDLDRGNEHDYVLNMMVDGNGKLSDGQLAYVKKNLVRIHIYYAELTIEVIEETPMYELSKAFADFGGIVGLYLGLSVSTGFEIIQYIAFLVVNWVRTRW